MIRRRFMVLLPPIHMQSTIFLFLCFVLHGSAEDTITPEHELRDGGATLVSAGEIFELGFFSPNEDSTKGRFVGIWYYNLETRTVVWVANRDQPLVPFQSGIFAIGEDGNLKVLDGNRTVVWSSSDTQHSLSSTRSIVKLMDSGNLVLRDNSSGETFWQSFDVPTHTFLPGMKMDKTLLTLTSWLSSDNPASGNYTFKKGPGQDEYIIMENEIQYWSSGDSESPHEEELDEVRSLLSNSSGNNSLISNLTETDKLRLVLTYSGEIQYYWPNLTSPRWKAPKDRCSGASACGKFSVCNTENYFLCKCLPGYEPMNLSRWTTQDFSDGCTRKSAFCAKNSSGNDTFLNLEMTKVRIPKSPDPIDPQKSSDCREACLDKCQCVAYILYNTMQRQDGPQLKCLFLTDDLTDLQENYTSVTYNLSVRVASSDIKPKARSCIPCGSTTIPYPLSDRSNCGDPLYSNFTCEKGQLMFEVNNDAYPVSTIIPKRLIFLIRLQEADDCSSQRRSEIIAALHPPFRMTEECKPPVIANGGSKKGIEVEISWDPPKGPSCVSQADCEDWPNSTCAKGDGDQERCFCNENFSWNDSSVDCTKRSGNFQGPSQQAYSKSPSRAVVVGIIIGVLVAILGIIACIAYLCKMAITKRKENRTNAAHRLFISESHVKQLVDSEQFKEDNKKGIDVPFFELKEIQAATDNFSYANKLGRGGFGTVYKGKFAGGQEMAIKRLSRASGQGLQEFKNEVVLIAKLQHRNLVRLLGYCIEGDEKILLYEYMPNKSLDSFIFDRNLCALLNWEMRFDIIVGIARGLLYLHQDSRLKIIHRDLKTSNILLDAEMNPKISDFGLARIFYSKQVEASTQRVVGTYGYMSPEYAMDGLFSQKSDVFSFGVVVLEIISGKRNTIVYPSDGTPSLLSHAWKLWEENKALELMDQTLRETCDTNQFLRCVNIGLLCVQDDPSDRPTMAAVVVLLSSDTSTLPLPKQPVFLVRRDLPSSVSCSSSKPEATLDSEFLASIEEGR